MDNIQSDKTGEDAHAYLRNVSFVPPEGGTCFMKSLPSELLSHVFVFGNVDEEVNLEDEDYMSLYRTGESDTDEEAPSEGGSNKDDEDTTHPEREGEEEEEENTHLEVEDEDIHVVEVHSDITGSSHHSSLAFPFLVSSVCRRWRNIAMSTPSLWTTIKVTWAARPPYESESLFLERSKSLPVDVYFDFGFPRNNQALSDIDLRCLLAVFTPHFCRCRTIKIAFEKYHQMYTSLIAAAGPSILSAPRLTTLDLRVHGGESDHHSLSTGLTLFGGLAPLLTRVVLWKVHVDWIQPWIASAPSLIDLELGDVGPTWAQFATILRGASALERLKLCRSGPFGDPEWFVEPSLGGFADRDSPIHLARLTDLTLMFLLPEHATRLVNKLRLPSLQKLALELNEGDFTDFVHELTVPATLSSPSTEPPYSLLGQLNTLEIMTLSCRIECVEILYAELQNLTSFSIMLGDLDDRFLDILSTPCTLDGLGAIWLPRLQTLRVADTYGSALCDLVRIRRDMGVPLTSLCVDEWSEVDRKCARWLHKNVKAFKIYY